jgi:23S rRNA pseudouridine1911/1915/1917 synthase
MKNPTALYHEIDVPEDCKGLRLDQALAKLFPQYSRSRLKEWIEAGKVEVDKKIIRPKDKLLGHEKIILEAELDNRTEWKAQEINLPIIYEDESIIIINKPIGMVVHPAAGNAENTLANALLHHYPLLSEIPRVGLIHRLDKETSGLLVVAKTLEAQVSLASQLEKREVQREYYAVVNGVLISGGTINAPIGRHPVHRQKMAVVDVGGKPAITHYRVIERFRAQTLLKILLETGRTHQIRVHMSYKGYPLVGDLTYGARPILPKGASPELMEMIRQYKHQALHARKLSFHHPLTNKMISFEAPLPDKIANLIQLLRENAIEDKDDFNS